MKNKKLILAAGIFVLVIAILAGVAMATRPQGSAGEKSISVVVVHGDESERSFAYTTAEEFLGPVILGEGLVEGEDGPYGLNIHTVDGETASWEENQSYWALFIGEEYATTGADATPLTDGETYKLVYTIG